MTTSALRGRILDLLAVPGIDRLVAAYFDPAGPFAGETFDLLGENPRDALSLDDLLATTLLDIRWRPPAVRMIVDQGDRISAWLAAVPVDLDLWEAGSGVLASATSLHRLLDGIPGVGPVTASKLLARKRPRLLPIHDEIVLRVLAPPPNQFWVTLAAALADATVRAGIETLRPVTAASPSLLRLLDVAIWTRHSGSRNAREARAAAGVPP